jgi:hypothetical protein
MARHTFVVFTNPTEGQEDEYNDWYDNTHLSDVLKVEGFVAAQRFKLADTEPAQEFKRSQRRATPVPCSSPNRWTVPTPSPSTSPP